MASKSTTPYSDRAKSHRNPLVQRLFTIAEVKKTNVIVSADVTTTRELLELADRLGPHIAVFKTHIDIVSDFGPATIDGLRELSQKHNFLIFEDRKLIDIGHTVQLQYHGGALRISEWAHFVNASVLAGDGIVDALEKTAAEPSCKAHGPRGLLLLAEMTTSGSLATGLYTQKCIDSARAHPDFVVGFVATRALTDMAGPSPSGEEEDFVIFTTGINRSTKGDDLGQQYNTPSRAISGRSDFIIAGRGIYAADDPVAAVKLYQQEGWDAYLVRTEQKTDDGK